jgi:tetratricopeptide (TPR) repeat protein
MTKIFISHSSEDDGFVWELREALADHGQEGWIDSRELRGGDPLWPVIEKAIGEASAYAVVVSPAALQSKWVGKELRRALEVQKERGKKNYPVIPLSLNGTKLGVLEELFGGEPVYLSVRDDAGGIEAAMEAILVALGKRHAADVPPGEQPKAEPLEELVLELTDLKFHEADGARRASARARLVYEPATPGQREVASVSSWRFVAPIGPIEAEELRWYLEKYAIWPSEYFRDRARKVEERLIEWGRLLYQSALPVEHVANVLEAWARVAENAGRRFSVHLDAAVEAGVPPAKEEIAREASTLLLGLPWELLHDGQSFLFQGARPVRVRRRLPNTRVLTVPVIATPIRILLVTARPEDDACSYLDHRSSALPLVEAMEALGGLVRLRVLSPPTLPALREELDRARRAKVPYHVVHFDGHGVYDRQVGLGGLCFEDPGDVGKLEGRRHRTVFTSELGTLLRDHRIPLVFLEACQTAQAEKASESVASELLKVGVASVVAMSHSVLLETARRFVEAFYEALARVARVGDAILAGQRKLKDDPRRGHVLGAGELRLEDWFVPVLFQEKDDPQLFRKIPGTLTQETTRKAHRARLGEVPEPPETGFIGRSRDLLALQRLLRHQRYAVVRGQGGEGKTALACEFARWMVRSHQVRRAAFVSVETHSTLPAVLDAIGRQLVSGYSFAQFGDLEKAILPVERALKEVATLLVLDNMESILLPPYLESAGALSEEARRELTEILSLCERLLKAGEARLVFTSREALPEPFAAERHRREIHRLEREDAVKLVERALDREAAGAGAAAGAACEPIEELVDAVHCHARTLALLGPALHAGGVQATRGSLVELMAEMEKKFPGSREKSLLASVELSLRRLSPANRDRARVLGVFHGGVGLAVLRRMMGWEAEDVRSLGGELIGTGLATPNRHSHLVLHPALCPYLRALMDAAERERLEARWAEAMGGYVRFIEEQQHQNTEMAATLMALELPNLFALLERTARAAKGEATIGLATLLFGLLQTAGRPRLIARVAEVRDAAVAALGEMWNHARFQAQRTRIEEQIAGGGLGEAVAGARELLSRARATGETAYPEAGYDLAMACFMMARVLSRWGGPEEALPLLQEAQARFEAISVGLPGLGVEIMASVCFSERGDCFLNLGRLDEAASVYDEGIRRAEERGDDRAVAVGKVQLGSVRLGQHRYQEALEAYQEARERFTALREPRSVAMAWHQTGMVHQGAGQPEAAEDAYRKALAIDVRLGDVAEQARTLNQLGLLYDDLMGRTEEAVAFLRQAVDKYVAIRDVFQEGGTRSNLAMRLSQLRRWDEARREIHRAIDCKEQFGHASQPWSTWAVLADIETDSGNHAAAAEARRRAIECYLAYHRDGGENHDVSGRICLSVAKALVAGDPAAAASLLKEVASDPDATRLATFIQALQAIVAGSRERSLADSPDFHPTQAAEIIFLLETLEKAG